MFKRSFVFIRSWQLNVYSRLCLYFQHIFKKLNIPFVIFDTIEECQKVMKHNDAMLVFLPFDKLCQYRDAKQDIPKPPRVEYILLVSEPENNIRNVMDYCVKRLHLFYAILNLNVHQDKLIGELFPNAIHFTCFQGFVHVSS